MWWHHCKGRERMATMLSVLILSWAQGAEIVVAEAPQSFSRRQAALWPPKLYAFCMESADAKERSLAEEAEMLRELGFDGAGYLLWHEFPASRLRKLGDELDANLRILDEVGLPVVDAGVVINVDPNARPYNPRFVEVIRKFKGRQLTISVMLTGLPPGDERGRKLAFKVLRELGDLAAKSGLRVSIYHHKDHPDHPPRQWVESFSDALEVVRQVDHPCVGVNFNVVHWLAVDGDRDYRPLLRANKDRVFIVTICGATMGSKTPSGLIQPLDRGDFDNHQLLATLREMGYSGPVGLQCFGISGDAREHLERSMQVWKTWKSEWAKETP